jgi:hypothetical protein
MSYSYSTLDEGHILILTMHADCDVVTEMRQMMADGNALADQSPAPIIVINDARLLYFANLNHLLEAVNAVRTVEPQHRVNRHPKVIKSLSVISSRTMQLAAKGLNTATFGHIQVSMFPTLEEALMQARALLREAGYEGLSAAG